MKKRPHDEHAIERRADSLLFVLANKPWTALFLLGVALGLFVAGLLVGTSW